MEEELKCPACEQLFSNPVLLPCSHALCLHCAIHLQQPASRECTERDESSAGSEPSSDYQEVDKLSILSETDSGVVCTSRPNSYVGTPNIQCIISLCCPICHKLVYFDENGAQNLPKYRAMAGIVDKITEAKNLTLKCQLCETDPAEASVICEQCEVLYCESCREVCHPSRGPLAKHSLVDPVAGRAAMRARGRASDATCAEHELEPLSLFCIICKQSVCPMCLEARHTTHEVQPIQIISKAQKTELSLHLQALSEKARSTTEFIQRLKGMTEKVNENCEEFMESVSVQCDLLVQQLQERKQDLLDFIKLEKEDKLRALKEQVTSCTSKLQQTTGLLQFCIEALKETDPVAFLQVGGLLIQRVAAADVTWYKDVLSCSRVSPQFDLTLDNTSLLRAIEQLNFIQMKPQCMLLKPLGDGKIIFSVCQAAKEGEERMPAAPNAPVIIPEECCAENNSVTIAWQQPPTSFVQGYVLELDDGAGGEFREVYCGKETICTVDGLHFNSMYNARVKAFNATGEGPYSDLLGLQTAEVAWFTFDPCINPGEMIFSEDHGTVSCEEYEHRVAIGTVGFSRGIHYWEFIINRFDTDTDPSFGVARLDVAKDIMLGKDDKGWSMYIDKKRSWFMHAGQHGGRTEGGIKPGSTVGVLLDLDRHQLSFFVNEEPQGPIAFQELYGVFYPAVSLNRGVSVTLHTAIDPPTDSDSI